MRMSFSNVGCLPDMDLDIDGLTVVTGENGTGKSTLLRAIYCVLQPSHGFEARKIRESVTTLRSIVQNSLGTGAFSPDDSVEMLLERARSIAPDRMGRADSERLDFIETLLREGRDTRFYEACVDEAIRAEFGSRSQMVNLRSDGTAVLRVEHRSHRSWCEVDADGVSWHGSIGYLPGVIYHDSPFTLDSASPVLPGNHGDMLSARLYDGGHQDPIRTMMGRTKRETFDSLVAEIVEGEVSDSSTTIVTRDGVKMDMRNIAAGTKVFVILRTLVDRGCLNDDSVLLLDGPEAHLHPRWINILAKVVAVMVSDMGVRVVMTTHSPQLLMAVEGASEDRDIHTSYYDLSPDSDGNVLPGPLSNLQPVYARMVGPITDVGARFMGE